MEQSSAPAILALIIAVLVIAAVIIGGIAVNGLTDAKSIAIRQEADRLDADAQHQRDMERREEQRQQAEFDAKLPAIIAEAEEDQAFSQALAEVWHTMAWAGPVAIAVILLPVSVTAGMGLAIALPILLVAFVLARRKRMELNATLIPLDPKTRQYPLVTRQVGNVLCIANPNDDSVLIINGERANPVPRKISASGYVQAAGMLGSQASRAKSSDHALAVAGVNPPLIDAGD